jgi:hypothetical protein
MHTRRSFHIALTTFWSASSSCWRRWRIINDSLRTDVSLLYPPYMISLAALHLACVIQQKDVKHWFAELAVDFEKVIEISRHVLSLYELWRNYDEKKDIAAILNKMPKPKLSASRQVLISLLRAQLRAIYRMWVHELGRSPEREIKLIWFSDLPLNKVNTVH